MILVKYIREIFYFVPIAIVGWIRVFIRLFQYLYSIWKTYPVSLKISLVLFFLQLVFSTRPWFEYKIRFYEADEVLSVSSKVNLIFIFLSAINFILLLSEVSFSTWLILSLQVIMGLLFLFGFQSPTSFHIDFINPTDYKFNINFYIFLVVNLLSLVTAILNFVNRKK